jgi:hypothetical protein
MPQSPLWNAVEIAVSMKVLSNDPTDRAYINGDADLDVREVQSQIHGVSDRDALCCTSGYTLSSRSISGRLGAKCYAAEFARWEPGDSRSTRSAWELVAAGTVVEDMQLLRSIGVIDLGVAVLVVATVIFPAQEMYAGSAQKGTDAERFTLALSEARMMARPDDGAAVDDLARRLGAADFKDWAIEAAIRGSEHAKQSPTRWRALLAVSVAFVDRLDVVPALDYANRALSACEDQRAACPSWEQIRMTLYQQHLDAGVKAGIDPRRGPEAAKAFRRAGESALRSIHLGGRNSERGATPAPTPAPQR